MADAGTRAADKAQAAMERKMRRIYRQAQREIIEKLNAQTQRMYALDAQKRADVESGKITPQQYKSWLIGQQFTQKQWKDKVDSVATTLLYANQQANAIVEGEKRAVFGENATYAAYEMEHGMGRDLSFSVYDSATVTKLLREDPELLPRRVVNGQKDKAWNRQKISAAVTQGIIQGESIPQIAKRIAKQTASSNMTAMTRYARTAMTSAQNAGRIEAMHHAQEMGIKVQKKWLATLDNRTRDAHAMLDGQVQDVDKPFQSELGPIMFPGDPSADPGNVYNCRCALQWIYPEYMPQGEVQRRDNINGELIKDMTYDEWKRAKVAADASSAAPAASYGKAVSSISAAYQKGAENKLDNAPDGIREVWGKYQGDLQEPIFGKKKNDDPNAYYDPSGNRVHFINEAKAYEKSTYQEEYTCFFHEYAHNIDWLAGGRKHYFSAEYNNGEFPKTLHEEIEGALRDYYLHMNPRADLWWEKTGFDYVIAESKHSGYYGLATNMHDYLQTMKGGLDKATYKALRTQIYDNAFDEGALRGIWDRYMANDSNVIKTLDTYRKHSASIGTRKTYITKQNAEGFSAWAETTYSSKFERSDISDMFDGYFDPMFGLNRKLSIGHDPGYFGSGGVVNKEQVATEAFAEMFSATTTRNQSLAVIRQFFPRSYGVFENMIGAMK